jgi:REP-associated tyrosine transposase
MAGTTVFAMPRPHRLQIAGGTYHLTSRGNRRQRIFLDDHDRRTFLGILAAVVGRRGWRCSAYCLMPNHYHLLVETPEPDISSGMQDLNSRYAAGFNWRYGLTGHLFQGRFHSILVEQEEHFLELARYLMLNPVRAGLCARPDEWRWSSYGATLGTDAKPPFLTLEPLLGRFGSTSANARFRFAAFVDDVDRARRGHVPAVVALPAVAGARPRPWLR